eukprot:5677789-Pleurochrysis_carterae.AAC.3
MCIRDSYITCIIIPSDETQAVYHTSTMKTTMPSLPPSLSVYRSLGLGTPAFYSIAAVFAYNVEQNAYVREVKDGMYSPAAVALANFLLQTPMTFVLGLVSALPTYAIGNLHWPSFAAAWAVWSTCLWCFEGVAMFFSLVANPLLGMLMFMNVWFSSFLFSGMFVRIEDVIWPFRLACYATPLGWTTTSLMYVVMIDTPEYDGAEPCDESQSFCAHIRSPCERDAAPRA